MVGLEAATLLLRSSTPGSHKKNPLAVSPFEDVPACGNGAAQPGGCGSGRRPRLRCRPWVRPGFGGFLGLASRVLLCMTIPLGRSFPSRPSFLYHGISIKMFAKSLVRSYHGLSIKMFANRAEAHVPY